MSLICKIYEKAPGASSPGLCRGSVLHRSAWALLAGSLALLLVLAAQPALAGETYRTVRLQLGTPDGRMVFVPSTLEFQVGQPTRLRIVNVSPVEHEFDAPEFILSVESERVEVFDARGHKVATLMGRPEEVRVSPGGRVDWYLLPLKPLAAAKMICDLPGHLQAGMHGVIHVR